MIGGLLAAFGAFCYALSSVAIAKSSQSTSGRGNDVILSVIMTAIAAGLLWLFFGPALPNYGAATLAGVSYFALAGVLANVLGRLTLFKSIELAGAIETGLIRRLIPVFSAFFAFIFLGEIISSSVVCAFLLVTGGVLIMLIGTPALEGARGSAADLSAKSRNAGAAMAVGSAAGYGSAFAVRKLAMQFFPDPLAGVFIGAISGLVWFCISTCLRPSGRPALPFQCMRRPTGWQFLSGSSITLGQVALYFSLMYSKVAVVAIISSIEVFFAAWLAGYVFKTESPPGLRFCLAFALAAAGVAILAVAPKGF